MCTSIPKNSVVPWTMRQLVGAEWRSVCARIVRGGRIELRIYWRAEQEMYARVLTGRLCRDTTVLHLYHTVGMGRGRNQIARVYANGSGWQLITALPHATVLARILLYFPPYRWTKHNTHRQVCVCAWSILRQLSLVSSTANLPRLYKRTQWTFVQWRARIERTLDSIVMWPRRRVVNMRLMMCCARWKRMAM
jgi:hypothetical protein